jgi:hypothetical protein
VCLSRRIGLIQAKKPADPVQFLIQSGRESPVSGRGASCIAEVCAQATIVDGQIAPADEQ